MVQVEPFAPTLVFVKLPTAGVKVRWAIAVRLGTTPACTLCPCTNSGSISVCTRGVETSTTLTCCSMHLGPFRIKETVQGANSKGLAITPWRGL
jgi:hypothetical protein